MSREYVLDWYKIPRLLLVVRGYEHVGFCDIEHSGCRFSTNVIEPNGNRVWPIEELLARKSYRPEQAQRIRKLNPYGKPEGEGCVLFQERS